MDPLADGVHLGSEQRGCVFCDKIAQGDDDAEHVLVRECTAY